MRDDDRLLTLAQYADAYPWPTACAIRNYIANPTKYSFPVHRVGRLILVIPAEIQAWALEQEQRRETRQLATA